MMYNWPPNTRAQQTLSGWCNSTLPFTYHPSRSSLFLLYGYGSRPTDSSACLASIVIRLALKISSKKGKKKRGFAGLLYFSSSKIYFFIWFSALTNTSPICLKNFLALKKESSLTEKNHIKAYDKHRQLHDEKREKKNKSQTWDKDDYNPILLPYNCTIWTKMCWTVWEF